MATGRTEQEILPEVNPAEPAEVPTLAADADAVRGGLWRQPAVRRLLIIALLAETGYAVLNISAMPVYLKFDRGFRESIIGLVLVAYLLSEAVFKGPMGQLADRIGYKRLIVIGPAMTVLTAILTLAVPKAWGASETLAIIGLRAIDGLGAAMLWPAAFSLMSSSVEDRKRQQGMSLLNLCYLVGVALALPLGGIANDLFGPGLAAYTGGRSPSLFFAAALFLVAAVLAYKTLPSGKEQRDRRSAAIAAGGAELSKVLSSLRTIPQYLLLAFVTFAGIGFPMSIIKLFAEQQFGMSESKFGFLVLPAVMAMAFLNAPMSALGERIGRARAVHVGMGMCVAGLAIVASGMLIPGARTVWALALGGIPVGLGFLLAIPAWFASVSEIDDMQRAANLGAVMTAQGIGAIVGAASGSVLYEKLPAVGEVLGLGYDFGRYAPFAGCFVFVLIGWLLSLRILRDAHTRPVES
jgi:DHA1 family multidrug resistance protein-like MFS transporter